MMELGNVEPLTLELEALAAFAYSKRLRLQTTSGLSGTLHLEGDPDTLVRELIRHAAIGQVFLRAAWNDPGRTLRSVRDHEGRELDAQIRALLDGRALPAPVRLEVG